MPRLFLYEECLAAGTQGPLGDEAKAFLPEGLAMTLAVAEDFARLPGWQVRVAQSRELVDATPAQVPWTWVDLNSPADLGAVLAREAQAADATLVIAPECGGLLQRRAQTVVDAGGTLLGPSPEWIALASDKSAILDHLAASGIRTPRGVSGTLSQLYNSTLTFPAVLKPNDGAGADDVRRINNQEDIRVLMLLRECPAMFRANDPSMIWRCEEFIPGKPASIALLCRPTGHTALQPATQHVVFDSEGHASYHGGALDLSPAEETRAKILGHAVLNVLPRTNGYIGVDLILGAALDGSQDTVIEVNPRMTTSYLGLRAATDDSLAGAMWQIARGDSADIRWTQNIVEFTKQGQVTFRDSPNRLEGA